MSAWADDLLTVSHGEHWTFIVDSDGPIDRAWLDRAFPPAGSDPDFTPAGAFVRVVFTMPTEPPRRPSARVGVTSRKVERRCIRLGTGR
jgi:hypothetical protein